MLRLCGTHIRLEVITDGDAAGLIVQTEFTVQIHLQIDLILFAAGIATQNDTGAYVGGLRQIDPCFKGVRRTGGGTRDMSGGVLIKDHANQLLLQQQFDILINMTTFDHIAAHSTVAMLYAVLIVDPRAGIVDGIQLKDLTARRAFLIMVAMLVLRGRFGQLFAISMLHNTASRAIGNGEVDAVFSQLSLLDNQHMVGLIVHRAAVHVHRVHQRYVVALTILYVGDAHILVVDGAKLLLVKGFQPDILTDDQIVKRFTGEGLGVHIHLVVDVLILVEGGVDHHLHLLLEGERTGVGSRIPNQLDIVLRLIHLAHVLTVRVGGFVPSQNAAAHGSEVQFKHVVGLGANVNQLLVGGDGTAVTCQELLHLLGGTIVEDVLELIDLFLTGILGHQIYVVGRNAVNILVVADDDGGLLTGIGVATIGVDTVQIRAGGPHRIVMLHTVHIQIIGYSA